MPKFTFSDKKVEQIQKGFIGQKKDKKYIRFNQVEKK